MQHMRNIQPLHDTWHRQLKSGSRPDSTQLLGPVLFLRALALLFEFTWHICLEDKREGRNSGHTISDMHHIQPLSVTCHGWIWRCGSVGSDVITWSYALPVMFRALSRVHTMYTSRIHARRAEFGSGYQKNTTHIQPLVGRHVTRDAPADFEM